MNLTIKYSQAPNPLSDLFADTPSVESEAEYKKLMIMEDILRLMKEQGINRSQLAERMDVAPSRITAMMSGYNNFTIETVVRAGRALGAELHQTFAPMGRKVRWHSYHDADVHESFATTIQRPTPVVTLHSDFTLSDTASDDTTEAA